MAERLLHIAKAADHPKATIFDITVVALREKMYVPVEHFKAYFLALLAEKEYSTILDAMAKVDKLLKKKNATADNGLQKPRSSQGSRMACWNCGTLGHRAAQCYQRRRHSPYARPRFPALAYNQNNTPAKKT